MDENTAMLIKKSGKTAISTWITAILALVATIFLLSSISYQMGWGEPDAQSIARSVISNPPTVIYTNDSRNCGGLGSMGGCFSTDTPDVIYVSPNLTYPLLKYVLLLELAHFKQYQEGKEIKECEADAQAKLWGADTTKSRYAKDCPLKN